MELANILVVIVYLLVICGIGIFSKNSKNSREYSVGKKFLPTFSIAVGLVAAHYGGGFLLGGAELGYKYGLYGLVYGGAAALGVLALGFFITHKISDKKRFTTVSSLLFKTYGDKKLTMLASFLSIIALVAIASAQIFSAVRIFNAIGLPVLASSLVLTFAIAIISARGISAFAKTAKYNLVIASVGGIIALFIAGTCSRVESNIQAGFGTPSVWLLLGIALPTIIYTLIGQDFHQKIYCAKDRFSARNACVIAFFILIVLALFPVIIGMKTNSLMSILPSEAMPSFIVNVVPSLFKGIFVSALLVAVLGSAQSLIISASTQLSEDLIKSKLKRLKSSVAPVSAVVFSFGALIIALYSSSIIGNLVVAYSLYTAGMFVPVIASLYLKNAKRLSNSIFYISLIGIISAFVAQTMLSSYELVTTFVGVSVSVVLSFIVYHNSVATKKRLQNKNLYRS